MKKYENVLKRVRFIEEKSGINYAKTDGKLYKTLKISYSIIGLYTIGINLIFILGMLLINSGTDNYKNIINTVLTVSACTLLLIAGYILNFFKPKLIAGIVSFIPMVFLILIFSHYLKDDLGYMGYKASFYWRHFIPLVLMIALIIWITVISVRARIKTDKQYKQVLQNIYNRYNIKDENGISAFTEEQWSEFLQNYDPNNYKKQYTLQEDK